ncbi:MAG TPA: inositol monophosphatase family protein [Gemmatales bacterium]|nr:inositol monophosphatase family protein [Gemmatales bacterium]
MEHNATWLEGAEEAARAGGEQLRHWRDRFQVSEKGRFDLVTDADHASQSAIRKVLLRRFPAHHFLGEETGGGAATAAADA